MGGGETNICVMVLFFVFLVLFCFNLLIYTDPPGPPTGLKPTEVTKDSVTLTWNEPDEDGGSPITGYWVERYDPEQDKWIKCNKMPVKDTTFK